MNAWFKQTACKTAQQLTKADHLKKWCNSINKCAEYNTSTFYNEHSEEKFKMFIETSKISFCSSKGHHVMNNDKVKPVPEL